jgi:fatty-acyl-CoA synthase
MTTPATLPAGQPHEAVWPRRLPRQLAVPRTSLCYNLEVSARRYPDKPACLFLGRALSYWQLLTQAKAVAGWLASVGVRKGDRVGLYLQNCPQFVAAFYGILRANAVVVPVNPMLKAEELPHYLTDAQLRVVVTSADLAAVLAAANQTLAEPERLTHLLVTRYTDAMPAGALDPAEAPAAPIEAWLRQDPPLPQTPGLRCERWTEVLAQQLAPPNHEVGPDDLAVLPYTSGTTGRPKGCMHTHGTIMANSVGLQWTHSGPEAVVLGALPMFHITGLIGLACTAVYAGASVVLLPRWDRELAARLIARHRVTHWTCIPTMIIDLFGSPNQRSFDLGSLRSLSGGGAAMPAAVAQRLQEQYGLSFAEGYGLTETAAATHANPPERPKLQCLGIPVFGVDARVIDPETRQLLPAGEVGEIVSHGPMVFKGYWRQPAATAEAFVEIDGRPYFRTGDLGRIDDEGYFFLTDRLKRMINASGYKVWPAEVEAMLYRHPAVQEACVIAARDAYRGETVKALVVLRAEARGQVGEQSLIDWAHEHMAAYKVPKIVKFVEALPKSAAGKVMWRLLQEQEGG